MRTARRRMYLFEACCGINGGRGRPGAGDRPIIDSKTIQRVLSRTVYGVQSETPSPLC